MSERIVKVQEFDRSTLLDIWLDGFCSGLSTATKELTHCTGEVADKFADDMALSIKADPAAMEMVRRGVYERVMGMVESNPATRELKVEMVQGGER